MEKYLPILLAALTIVVLGCWNPPSLQVQTGGKPTGCPNYLWLALISLAVGLLTCYVHEKGDALYF